MEARVIWEIVEALVDGAGSVDGVGGVDGVDEVRVHGGSPV